MKKLFYNALLSSASIGPIEPSWFRSRQSGNWDESSTWEKSTDNGLSWSLATRSPTILDSVYCEGGFTVNNTSESECYHLYVSGIRDGGVRITGSKVKVYNDLSSYKGSVGESSFQLGDAGSFLGDFGFMASDIEFIESGDRNIFTYWASNSNRNGSYDQYINCGNDTLTSIGVLTASNLYIQSGTLNMNNNGVRCNGALPPNDVSYPDIDGEIIVESGANILNAFTLRRDNLSTPRVLTNINLKIGSVVSLVSHEVDTSSYSFNGEIILMAEFPKPNALSIPLGAVNLENFYDLTLDNSATKTLNNNITINNNLKIKNNFILDRDSYDIIFNSSANITYTTTNRTTSNEFIETTDTTLIPNDLIVDGVELTLDSDKNIRGTVQLLNSGTINYNGFNIAENYT